MNKETYEKACETLTRRRCEIIISKRPEYTEGNVDVLHNFKVVARELGLTPEQVWYVYFRKHVASISQYCSNPTHTTAEPITDRIADAMNYLELLYALTHANDPEFVVNSFKRNKGPTVDVPA